MSVRLLLVDDEFMEREVIRLVIGEYTSDLEIVGEATNGKEAISLARSLVPDIILMDIKMPILNGLDAAIEIKKELPYCRIILLTAYDEFDFAKEAVNLGASDYLLKPVRPEDLIQVIRKLSSEISKEQELKREKEVMSAQVQEITPLLMVDLTRGLIEGRVMDDAEAERRMHSLGIPLGPWAVIVVDSDSLKALPRGSKGSKGPSFGAEIQTAIETKLEETMKVRAIVFYGSQSELIVLLSFAERVKDGGDLGNGEEKLYALQAARLISDVVGGYVSGPVSMGIGRFVRNLIELNRSYLEARRALEYSLLRGCGAPIHIEDAENLHHMVPYYPRELEQSLIMHIRDGDVERARDTLFSLINTLIHPYNVEPKALRSYLQVFLFSVASQAFTDEIEKAEGSFMEAISGFATELMSVDTEEKMRCWCDSVVEWIFTQVRGCKVNRKKQLVHEVLEFIDRNYGKPLSLEEVAKEIHVSPFYLCRVFKEVKGSTFLEYLTSVRIHKAKVLLRTTGHPISMIARAVGYPNPSYFSQIFKEVVGTAPVVYRAGVNLCKKTNE